MRDVTPCSVTPLLLVFDKALQYYRDWKLRALYEGAGYQFGDCSCDADSLRSPMLALTNMNGKIVEGGLGIQLEYPYKFSTWLPPLATRTRGPRLFISYFHNLTIDSVGKVGGLSGCRKGRLAKQARRSLTIPVSTTKDRYASQSRPQATPSEEGSFGNHPR